MNTDKLIRFKIDLLLRLNTTITANTGKDSSKAELTYCKKLTKENLKKIKELDPEFFSNIKEDEV